jgi:hypothetical protein
VVSAPALRAGCGGMRERTASFSRCSIAPV